MVPARYEAWRRSRAIALNKLTEMRKSLEAEPRRLRVIGLLPIKLIHHVLKTDWHMFLLRTDVFYCCF